MKELTVEAKIENIEAVTDFVNEQLEALDCPMKAQMRDREETIAATIPGLSRE